MAGVTVGGGVGARTGWWTRDPTATSRPPGAVDEFDVTRVNRLSGDGPTTSECPARTVRTEWIRYWKVPSPSVTDTMSPERRVAEGGEGRAEGEASTGDDGVSRLAREHGARHQPRPSSRSEALVPATTACVR